MKPRYQPGDRVLPVSGPVRTMNPHRYCLGKAGYVVKLAGSTAGMYHYEIDVDGFIDHVDECNLEPL